MTSAPDIDFRAFIPCTFSLKRINLLCAEENNVLFEGE